MFTLTCTMYIIITLHNGYLNTINKKYAANKHHNEYCHSSFIKKNFKGCYNVKNNTCFGEYISKKDWSKIFNLSDKKLSLNFMSSFDNFFNKHFPKVKVKRKN